ncbi:uncharacterized protein DUF742 [Knoellia remsis]|uniref:Uncharacterized protein DUF742 n=1 Tax=Knoellia remsis TaxID=407159 RepID=A0A2T0UEH5_9MICO|nr:DUF742 domain-containing protein [Knoellia remsis]PRY56340.1 uncharacterized protein DUF742 [Knoellia remsis]
MADNSPRPRPDRSDGLDRPVRPGRPDDHEDEHTPLAGIVRPYALTSGRTHSSVDLPVEALVESLPRADDHDWTGQDQVAAIVAACDERTSVAEVSAQVGLPIGVVRVLLGDLVEQGFVTVSSATLTDASSVGERRSLIERTLRGLRAI